MNMHNVKQHDVKRRFLISLALTLLLGITGHAQETPNATDWERFERAGMVSEASVDFEDIQPDGIGFTPEKAAVALYFDLDRNLLSAERHNSLIMEGTFEQDTLEPMYIDFTTFREVMEEKLSLGLITQETLDTVDLKYVSGLPGSPVEGAEDPSKLESNALGAVIYLYDAYQTSYQTYEEIEAEIEEKMKRDRESIEEINQILEQGLPGGPLDDEPDPLADPPSDD